ncbi:hypothetical protein [uncultured Vibrio sp.]|nr:hypothetical protein [uncultured Vibrio sp.]
MRYAITVAKAILTRLVNVFVMGAVNMTALVFLRAKSGGTAASI